jgi:hypothetical protein
MSVFHERGEEGKEGVKYAPPIILYALKDARTEIGLAACMSILKKLW